MFTAKLCRRKSKQASSLISAIPISLIAVAIFNRSHSALCYPHLRIILLCFLDHVSLLHAPLSHFKNPADSYGHKQEHREERSTSVCTNTTGYEVNKTGNSRCFSQLFICWKIQKNGLKKEGKRKKMYILKAKGVYFFHIEF